MMLYECGVRFDKMMENGMVKKVTELYLVDALTFTEAEARIISEVTPFISGEFDVVTIKRTNYSEIVFDEFNLNSESDAQVQKITRANSRASEVADKWFKAKINFILVDEKTGKEKKQAIHYIINAGSINAAHDTLVSHMKGTMTDYEIATLDETRIMDVYVYSADGSKSVGVKSVNSKRTTKTILDAVTSDKKLQRAAKKVRDTVPEGMKVSAKVMGSDGTEIVPETVIVDKSKPKDDDD